MNLDAVRRMADAVLYEGYILYPYRASAQKNRSRWQFGVVMPPGYTAADPSESAVTQTECVLEHSGQPTVQVILRFLQVQRRTVEGSPAAAWDEAVEREIEFTVDRRRTARRRADVKEFAVAGGEDREPLADGGDPRTARAPEIRSAAGNRWPARCRCGRLRWQARGGRSGSGSGWRT